MDIRAMFIDMDGTLLTSSNKISRRNTEAVNRLVNQGVEVFLATGRQYEITAPYHRMLGLKTPMICLNGASIHDGLTGNVAQKKTVTLDEERFHQITHERANNVMMHTTNGLYCKTVSDEVNQWTKESGMPPSYIGDLRRADCQSVLKYSVRTGRHGSDMSYMFKEQADVIDWPDGFEIVAPGVSKWSSIQTLLHMFGINPAEAAAIGDGPNDIQMLRHAGVGVAMENAVPEATAAADLITKHHEHDGLADFIERHLVKPMAI
ncbi:hypothetical protein SAMN05216238_103135 [Lentibacillus persicus]|uniref:Cof subfamily of IIB subfamily of haloacid dehalogenase superfamily/HAD-superfamily hydrolase, subfamily IIB n=1 Tax=Lentibacillus persicus TaxID=640948 RepID=A0A1I1UC51_9BACI|nr:HAD family hydrolase [Lentibacillus persicus]SFD68264.1 hypothetical protein SAMN05216238_103135 [Lentibacillus persicus]